MNVNDTNLKQYLLDDSEEKIKLKDICEEVVYEQFQEYQETKDIRIQSKQDYEDNKIRDLGEEIAYEQFQEYQETKDIRVQLEQDQQNFLETSIDVIDFNDSFNDEIIELSEKQTSNAYIDQIKKRFANKKNLKNKSIYIYTFYKSIQTIINNLTIVHDFIYGYIDETENVDYVYYIDETKEIAKDLKSKLEKERLENTVYNISIKKCCQFIDCLDNLLYSLHFVDSECMDIDCLDESLELAKIINSTFEEKKLIYKLNRSRHFTKRKEKENTYFNLKEQGYSASKIAQKLNISKQAVYQYFKRHT